MNESYPNVFQLFLASLVDLLFRKIFIGGLSYSTDDGTYFVSALDVRSTHVTAEKLRQYFQVYGTVQDAVVMKDPVSRRSRGFGFITFTDVHAVDNPLAHDPHTIDSRKVVSSNNLYLRVNMDVGGGQASGASDGGC